MAITLGRISAVRQMVKDCIDRLHAEYPGPDVDALHASLNESDGLLHGVCQRIFDLPPEPLDGDPKPGH